MENWKVNPFACFLIGVTGPGWTNDGNALLGSVSDDPYDIRTFLKMVRPPQGIDYIGTELISTTEHTLTERGYFARPGETTRGINEAGLAFTCAMVIEDKGIEPQKDLATYADVTEKMMRTCESVEDALALFKSVRGTSPSYTVLVADAKGYLAQIETGSFGIVVLHQYSPNNPGVVLAVNCYQAPSLVQFNAPVTLLSNAQNNNANRLNRGRQLADQFRGRFNVQTLAKVLSDHANKERDPMQNPVLEAWGYSICNHGTRRKDDFPPENLPWGTVSAEIMEPSSKRFWYSYGWPCGSQPEYGDQIFQEKSWGKFLPFTLNSSSSENPKINLLTSIGGDITAAGIRCLDFSVTV